MLPVIDPAGNDLSIGARKASANR